MKVYHDTNDLPTFKNAVLTIGSFDGVHLGHRKLIQKVKDLAAEVDGEDVLITFHPHPRSVIYPNDDSLKLLSSLEEKLALLEDAGVSNVMVMPFTIEFSQQSPQEYIEEFLIKSFDPSHIVIGYDHKFGLNRQGDIYLLQQYQKQGKFEIVEIKKQELEDIAVSSTKIRNALLEGDISNANAYLCSNYSLSGSVVKGDQIGTSIGYPTANIKVKDSKKLIPADGVYACKVSIGDLHKEGMLYIGNRPTLEGKLKHVIEVNIFDFSDSIYHEEITVCFKSFIRGSQKFANLDGLKQQLGLDKDKALSLLKRSTETQKVKTDCTVAILNYNGEEHLETYLHTVQNNLPDNANLVVIDNGSTDASIEYIEDWFPEIEINVLSKNYGFAEGYNVGMKSIDTKYTVLLNSDVKTGEDWLTPILKYMDQNPDIGAVQPKILSVEEPTQYEYAGAAGGFVDKLFYPFCRGRIFDTIEQNQADYDQPMDVFWVSGCAMVVRTEVYKKLGGLDGDYFAHMEEIDLCWRIHRAGYRCVVMPEVKVYHLGGGTLSYESPRKTYLNFRNNLTTILKNKATFAGLGTFAMRLVLDGIAGIKMLIDGKPKNTMAIIKAHFAVYGSLGHIYRKKAMYNRMIAAASIGPEDKSGWYSGSILVSYYLKGKKTFSQLKTSKFTKSSAIK